MRCSPLAFVLPALLVFAGCAAETPSGDDIPDGMTVEIIRPLVLSERARVPENDANYEGVEVYDDRVVFLLSGELSEPLAPDHVIGGRGDTPEEDGYLRTVVSVGELVDGRLEVMTERAGMTEFLADGHFRVHYDPPGDGPGMTDVGEGVVGRSDALGGRGGAIVLVGNPTGLRCGVGAARDVTLTPEFSINPEFEAELDLGFRGPSWRNPIPGPKVDEFFLKMGAEVTVGLDIESEGGWDAICVMDFYDGAALPDFRLPKISFMVGFVPVWIDNEIEPIFTFDVDARVATDSFASHQSATIGLEAGVRYRDGDWEPIWEPSADTSGGVTATDDAGGNVSATLRLSAGLEYQARLYSQLGPNFGLEMFVEKEVGVDAPDYCEWFEQVDAGITATFGGELEIDAGPIDWTVAQIQIGEVDLLRFPVASDAGTFPWCDGCTSANTCIDDLGREICDGGRGVLECGEGSGYYQSCVCTASGLVDCGICSR